MRVDRRDILPTTPQVAFTAAPMASAIKGLRGHVSLLPLAR
jgi:hypothetical protein